jgi:hypothetical protein
MLSANHRLTQQVTNTRVLLAIGCGDDARGWYSTKVLWHHLTQDALKKGTLGSLGKPLAVSSLSGPWPSVAVWNDSNLCGDGNSPIELRLHILFSLWKVVISLSHQHG